MGYFYLSAAHKSSGKTTLSVGICAALRRRGLRIQPFKKGPDYIDPIWLSAASGQPCYNLDFYTMGREEISALFVDRGATADISIIEGNKGLYDGMALDGSDSNAGLAELLQAPVVLVLDVRGITRGLAPLLLGYQSFASGIHITGLILNRVAGVRHGEKLRQVAEHYTDLPLIGMLGQDERLSIDERHLGLMPSNEMGGVAEKLDLLANAVSEQVDLDQLLQLAKPHPQPRPAPVSLSSRPAAGLRIGYLQDRAFGFYYPDDVEKLTALGAELLALDALHQRSLPQLDGLIIGGGFPETAMAELSANRSLRHDIGAFIEAGGPVYAECGGLMYLSRSISWKGQRHEMVGVIQGDAVMYDRPQGRGYVRLRETGQAPWGRILPQGGELAAHEFHYSALENLTRSYDYAYQVVRGFGIDGQHDGLVYKNLLANYSHMRAVGENHWVERFLTLVKRCKSGG